MGEAVDGLCAGCGDEQLLYRRPYRSLKPIELFADRTVVRCQRCALESAHPMPTQAELDRFYATGGYDSGNAAVANARSRWNGQPRRADAQSRLVTQSRGVPASWLDIGTGYGGLLEAARMRGVERLAAIEPTPARRAVLEGRGIEVFDGVDSARTQQPFDIVSFSHLLEHVADPVGFVRSAAALVSDRGAIFCEVPNAVAWIGTHDDPHVTFFSPAALEEVLRRAGLVPLQIVTAGAVVTRPKIVRGVSSRAWELASRLHLPDGLARLHPDYREGGMDRIAIRAIAVPKAPAPSG